MESINVTSTYKIEANQRKETLSTYGNKGEENISSMSENKENHAMVIFVCMNAVKASYIQSMNVRAHQRLCISLLWKNLCHSKKSKPENIRHRIMFATELERYDADLRHSTADFEENVNITFDSASVILQENQSGNEEYCQVNPYDKDEVNKRRDENASKQKEITSKYIEKIASEQNPSRSF